MVQHNVTFRPADTRLFNDVLRTLSAQARRDAETRYPYSFQEKSEPYHIREYKNYVVRKVGRGSVVNALKNNFPTYPRTNFMNLISKMPNEGGTSEETGKLIFQSLADAQGICLLQCFVEFLEFCLKSKNPKRPLVAFKNGHEGLSKRIADIRNHIKSFQEEDNVPQLNVSYSQDDNSLNSENYKKREIWPFPSKYTVVGISIAFLIVAIYTYSIANLSKPDSTLEIGFVFNAETGAPEPVIHRSNYRSNQDYYSNHIRDIASYDVLIEGYRSGIEYSRKSNNTRSSDLSSQYILLGQALTTSAPNEAIDAFKSAISLSPNSSIAHYGMGEALFRIGKVEQALNHFEKVEMFADENDHLQLALSKIARASVITNAEYDLEAGKELIISALKHIESIDEPEWKVMISMLYALSISSSADHDSAAIAMDNLIGKCEEIKYKRLIGNCFNTRSVILESAGEDSLSEKMSWRALEAYENAKDFSGVVMARNNLSDIILEEKGISAAESWLKENLNDAEKIGYIPAQISALKRLSNISGLNRQNHAEALGLKIKAINLARNYPDPFQLSGLLRGIASKARIVGNTQLAWDSELEAFNLELKLNRESYIFSGAMRLSKMALAKGDNDLARDYWSYVEKSLKEMGSGDVSSQRMLSYFFSSFEYFDNVTGAKNFLNRIIDKARQEENITSEYEALEWLSIINSSIDEDIEYYESMLELAKKTNDSTQLEKVYHYLGKAYYELDKYDIAIEFYKKSENIQINQRGYIDQNLAIDILAAGLAILDISALEAVYDVAASFDLADVNKFSLRHTAVTLSSAALLLEKHDDVFRYTEVYKQEGGYHWPTHVYYHNAVNKSIETGDSKAASKYFDYLKKSFLLFDMECKCDHIQSFESIKLFMLSNDLSSFLKNIPPYKTNQLLNTAPTFPIVS